MSPVDANDLANSSFASPAEPAEPAEPSESAGSAAEPRELSTAAAVCATVLAVVAGAAVMLAFFHWLGWSIPVLGVLVAKLGIKLTVGGVAGLAAAAAWLRARRGGADRT
ncbi:hypothetical protein PUR71_36660 [Streptomyces sp. SP17BM10]|uniref:hypothetical protein n=1 Tax=Streptomyces sp. SP17BM10 TaxID=3002530 RepID=UPI002E781146|nr:hypothetical protein [Streptomyces sp. SP17BM10]MEE1788392.1 hypothetical protein [Streptomyces sp. SP17BM10]